MTVETRPRPKPELTAKWLNRPFVPWVAGALTSSALSLFGAVLVFRLWLADFSAPLSRGGDTNAVLMMVRNMQVGGWPRSSPWLNAPLGQDMRAYPNAAGELLNLGTFKVLSLFLSPAQVVNVTYLLGYVAIASMAFIALYAMRVRPQIAIPIAAAYSWLPYHFLRGVEHLFLSNYSAMPLAVAAAVAIYRDGAVRLPATRRGRTVLLLGVAAVLGSTGIYYAAFSLVLIAAAAVLRAIGDKSWRPLRPAALMAATTVFVAAVPAIPSILYRLSGGASAAEGRSYAAAEYFGLKITNLFLPIGGHRIPRLGQLSAGTAGSYIPGEGSEALGLLGVAGILIIAIVALLPAARRGPLVDVLRPFGVLVIVMVIVATVAGLNGLFVLAGLAELRAWNRSSVVVAFLALAGLAIVLSAGWDRVAPRIGPRRLVRTGAAVVTVALICAFALFDQSGDHYVLPHERTSQRWAADERYFAQVEAELGTGTQVFQLPVAEFPESPPIVKMADYEHFRGYLHSDLRWSYGGIKDSAAEWQFAAVADGIEAALPALVATGFEAVYINRLGYEDEGAAVEAELRRFADGPPLVNEDGTLAVYSIREYAAELREAGDLPDREEVLSAPHAMLSTGSYPPETEDGETWQWVQGYAELVLWNPTDEPQRVTVDADLFAAVPGVTVTVTLGDQTQTVELSDGSAPLRAELTLPPGRSMATITNDGPAMPTQGGDTRDLRLQISDLSISR